ncbi:MAG: hypothetical protein J7J73_02800 [Deltaproteobacteria bacterium]|nr:hypothetical protein [Deltaproteobacteria bacterium]
MTDRRTEIGNFLKDRLPEWAEKLKEQAEDLLTLTITTKIKTGEKEEEVAKTNFYVDGDIECVIPVKEGIVNKEILDIHQALVKEAMENRTELLKILINLFKLSDIIKLS